MPSRDLQNALMNKGPKQTRTRRATARPGKPALTWCLFLLGGWCVLVPDARSAEPAHAGYGIVSNILYRAEAGLNAAQLERCRLDLYYPTNTPGFAAVVWFHGGGLTEGRRAFPAALEGRGIGLVAAGYRLSPQVKSPGHVEDAAAAVAWVLRHITEYGGASNRVYVAGHSAGGYLTLMVGLDKRWLGAHGLDPNAIAGLIPYSGQCITHFTVRAETGIPNTRPVIDERAPLFYVRPDAPPLLLITGDRERELLGRYEENAYLWRMMREAGHTRTRLIELKGFDHGGMAEPAHPLLLEFIQAPPRAASAGPE